MSFSVTILGSSSAIPTSKRNLTAHLVDHDERFFLIDCGEGTQIQLRRFKTKFSRINHIFISHLHGDHIFGLFGLLSSLSMMGRKSTLTIYSDPRLIELLTNHFNFFKETLGYTIEYKSFGSKKSQIIYDDGKLEVITIPLKHRVPCVGFQFRGKPKLKNIKKEYIEIYKLGIKDIISIKNGNDYISADDKVIKNEILTTEPPPPKTYTYCSDTKALNSIIPYIENTDLLYHESTFLNKDYKLAKATYHSTTGQAAELAQKANVKKLLIGHFSSRYKDESKFLKEAQDVFPNTFMAEDGMEIEV
jgi:ribonuclease Z